MKNYPRLLRKYMSDKGKISPLAEIFLIMNLEIYSLKRQEQVFRSCSLVGYWLRGFMAYS